MQNNRKLIYRESVLRLLKGSERCCREEATREGEPQIYKDVTNNIANMLATIASNISRLSVIDATPVVHSRWINEVAGYRNCLECGCEHPVIDSRGFYVDDDYCPKCGAKMDLKEDGDT